MVEDLHMDCPKCGYVMSDLDVECPRCKRMGEQGASPTSQPTSQATAVPYSPPRARPETSVRYAGFWLRVAACIVDSFATSIVGFVLGAFAGGMVGGMMGAGGASAEEIQSVCGNIGTGMGVLGNWLYHALMESSYHQATLGKMALGVKVVDLDGDRISFGRATGRFFAKYLSALALGIGFLMVIWHEKKQGLHDIVAGTLVVVK